MNSANYNELKWGLEELASKEDQIRLWCNVGNDSNEISSLTEATCIVFNLNVERILENKNAAFDLPNEAISLLMDLSKKLEFVPEDISPEKQVEHPVMDEVRTIAKKLLSINL